MLFLTTNRVGTIDEALRSRIHMSLFYPNPNETQTVKIWEGLLARAKRDNPNLVVNQDEIVGYARNLYRMQMSQRKINWTGRQLRNAMQNAVALAEHDSIVASSESATPVQSRLETKHLRLVADASWEFETYLEDVQCISVRADTTHREQEHLVMPTISAFGPSWQCLSGTRHLSQPRSQSVPLVKANIFQQGSQYDQNTVQSNLTGTVMTPSQIPF
jgi:SpoVK/Ycf46/Vps4 family AAA+-type ATPase